MKKIILAVAIIGAFFTEAAAQTEYKVVTVVESIVPMGMGRSRIVEATTQVEYEQFTTERTEGKDGRKQGKVKRGDAKIEGLRETKLLNFYSGVGLNFQNIASNDALITSMLNSMSKDGWELFTVAAGVESKGSKDDNAGIFITRYLFKK
jgi:hypothetical protein